MNVQLIKATEDDAVAIFNIQIEAFTPLLKKYEDDEINPANETIERLIRRMNRLNGCCYKILADGMLVGAICIFYKANGEFWISPMFISPAYQGKGIAQKAIVVLEAMFPEAVSWELATILEEARNCYFYEKMGYKQTSVSKKVNERTTLIFYKKVI